MWRTGILTRERFLASVAAGTAANEAPRISLQLLDIGESPHSPQDIEIFEHVSRIFQTSSGVYRTTYPHRLDDLNDIVNQRMRAHFPLNRALIVEDRAASHALTSAEWAGSLQVHFPLLQMRASDTLLYLWEARGTGGIICFLEPGGTALQMIHPPFVLPLRAGESWHYPVNRWQVSLARRKANTIVIPDASNSEALPGVLARGDWQFRRISLVHPQALELERAGFLRIEEGSVFDRSSTPAHVIRTMNILSPTNFNRSELLEAAKAIHASLVPDGIWIVGRTTEGAARANHASILRRAPTSFHLLERFGDGWEEEEIALTNVASAV